MTYPVGHFINGKVLVPLNTHLQDIYNPALGQVIGQVTFAGPDVVEAAVSSAATAFPAWSTTPPLKRARIILEFRNLLLAHLEELAALITQEHGKTLEDAKGSILRAIELTEFFGGIPHLLTGSYSEQVGTKIDSYSIRQPIGVSVGITPFNFPVMVPIWMFIPAIACGNTFILKPSEKDPSPAVKLAELFQQAGLPDGVLNVLNGDKKTVETLITHPLVDTVSAVGSTPVAEYIYQQAIQHGKRAHTFGGAKNHCIVMPDADLDRAANAIASAAFGSAGERCMAISAVVAVTDQVADQLVDRLSQIAKQLKIGPGNDPQTEMGPLISKEHLMKVRSYIESGIAEGAKLVVDGRHLQLKTCPQGFFLGANVFDHVTENMKIYQEEIFGPVLVVLRVSDFATALNLVNQHVYGNGTAIFTRDGGLAHQFASEVKVGMVGINVPIPVPVAYHSFGGWKRSVFGDIHLHAKESVTFYTRVKTITARWPEEDESNSYSMPET